MNVNDGISTIVDAIQTVIPAVINSVLAFIGSLMTQLPGFVIAGLALTPFLLITWLITRNVGQSRQ